MVFVFSNCRILWISISTSSRKVRFIMFIIALLQQRIKPVQIFTKIAQFTRTALNSSPSSCALSDHLHLFQNLILRPNQVVHLPVFIHGDHSLITQSAVEIAEPEIMLHVALQSFLIQDKIASSTFNIFPRKWAFILLDWVVPANKKASGNRLLMPSHNVCSFVWYANKGYTSIAEKSAILLFGTKRTET